MWLLLCFYCHFFLVFCRKNAHAGIQRRGGQGFQTPPPWKITKLKGFLAILVRIPWKITKLLFQHSMLGHYWLASKTPFKWPAYSGIWILSPLINLKNKTKKKTLSELDPLWQNILDLRMAHLKCLLKFYACINDYFWHTASVDPDLEKQSNSSLQR